MKLISMFFMAFNISDSNKIEQTIDNYDWEFLKDILSFQSSRKWNFSKQFNISTFWPA